MKREYVRTGKLCTHLAEVLSVQEAEMLSTELMKKHGVTAFHFPFVSELYEIPSDEQLVIRKLVKSCEREFREAVKDSNKARKTEVQRKEFLGVMAHLSTDAMRAFFMSIGKLEVDQELIEAVSRFPKSSQQRLKLIVLSVVTEERDANAKP